MLCMLAGSGSAEEKVEASAPVRHTHPSGEILGAKVRYGVVLREGSQEDQGPGLSYDGLTPNDVQLQLGYFPLDLIGAELQVEREAFGLFQSSGSQVTSGALLRGHLGPKLRVKFGPVRLEALGAFQYAQLPEFGSTASPKFRQGARQGVLLASNVLVDLPAGLNLHGRAEYPLSLSASDSAGNSGRSSGFAAGGGLGYTLGTADTLAYGLELDYQYVTDRLEVGSAVSQQTLQRIGAALTLNWLDAPPPPPPPKLGDLFVQVTDEKGAPIANAPVSLVLEGGEARTVTTDANGAAAARGLPPGMLVAKVSAGGYLPAEARAEVHAGERGDVRLGLQKAPPKTGAVLVTIVDADGNRPLEGAVVSIGDRELLSAADGTVRAEGIKPGALGIKVSLKGYTEANEAATVTAGRESQVPISLVAEKKKVPATITGLVRSTRGGAPVPADLEIPELKLKTRADANGAFTMRVPGGTYRVIISARGYLKQQKSVTVKDGDQAIFNVDLFPGRGR